MVVDSLLYLTWFTTHINLMIPSSNGIGERTRRRRAQCDNILSVILQRPHVGVIVISKHDMICWMGRNMLRQLKAKQPPKTFWIEVWKMDGGWPAKKVNLSSKRVSYAYNSTTTMPCYVKIRSSMTALNYWSDPVVVHTSLCPYHDIC